MPSNQTPNYKLSQWERADKVQMEDFNADNAKIDAAIKAESDARTALAARVAQKGNCQIWTGSYIGTGTCGPDHPTSFTFPQKPLLAMITAVGSEFIAWLQPTSGYLSYYRLNSVTWSGNTASWHVPSGSSSAQEQLNYKGGKYYVVAFMAADQ